MSTAIDNQTLFSIILVLMTELSDKRHGVVNDNTLVEYDDKDKDYVIGLIKKKYNLDYYEVLKSTDSIQLLEYETILGQFFTEYLEQFKSDSEDEEIRILGSAKEIHPNSLPEMEIEKNEAIDRTFKLIKETSVHKYLNTYLKQPDYVSLIDVGNKTYITTKKITNSNGIDAILFSVLREHKKYIKTTLFPLLVCMFNYRISELRYDSPVRMLLYLLNKYGIDVEIGNCKKHLFFGDEFKDIPSGEVYSLIESQLKSLSIKKKGHVAMISSAEMNDKDDNFIFTFCLTDYANDYNLRKI